MKRLPIMRRHVMPRLAACTGAFLTAVTVTATVAPPSTEAAVTTRFESAARVTLHRSAAHGAVTEASSSKEPEIVCKISFRGANGGVPHHSGHFPGSVNVRVGVTCLPDPVTAIQGVVGLFQVKIKKGKLEILRKRLSKYGSRDSRTAKGNAALICKPGYYEGDSVAIVTFPPGYQPHKGVLSDHTRVVRISKC